MKKQEKNNLVEVEEQECLDRWRKITQKTVKKSNSIMLDNKSMIDGENGKPIQNPDFGKLKAVSYTEDGEEIIEEMKVGDEFYPAHVRVHAVCRDYDDGPQGKIARYTCEEVDQGHPIEVKDSTGEIVFRGYYSDAKEEYNLKYKVVIYTWFKDKMYRWKIGGMDTLGSWFAVNNTISAKNYPHTVKIKDIKTQSNSTIFWNDIVFEVGNRFDVRKALELNTEVMNSLENYYSKKQEKVKELEGTSDIEIDNLPF